jgi:hypothetical protein
MTNHPLIVVLWTDRIGVGLRPMSAMDDLSAVQDVTGELEYRTKAKIKMSERTVRGRRRRNLLGWTPTSLVPQTAELWAVKAVMASSMVSRFGRRA